MHFRTCSSVVVHVFCDDAVFKYEHDAVAKCLHLHFLIFYTVSVPGQGLQSARGSDLSVRDEASLH